MQDTNKYPSYSTEEISALAEETSPLDAINTIVTAVRNRFPYKSYTVSLEQARQMVANLRDYQPEIVARQYHSYMARRFDMTYVPLGSPALLVCRRTDYKNYNVAIERYSDPARMNAQKETKIVIQDRGKQYSQHKKHNRTAKQHRIVQPSPATYFASNTFEVVADAIRRFGRVDAYTLREAVYHLAAECTEMRTDVCVGMYKYFGATRVLDPCAGRGSRLLAAIAAGIEYVGVDPATEVHSIYAALLDDFTTAEERKKYRLIQSPFEDLDETEILSSISKRSIDPEKTFDLIFTSPPYFALEHYTNEETQSIERYPTLKEWLERFLYVMMDKAWNCLAIGGHMVLNISDYGDVKYMEELLAHGRMLPGAEYRGIISYAEVIGPDTRRGELHTTAQPMWCWRKNE